MIQFFIVKYDNTRKNFMKIFDFAMKFDVQDRKWTIFTVDYVEALRVKIQK